MRRISCLIAAVLVLGCKGADGATGPQGPTGPQGAQGPTGPQGPVGPAAPAGQIRVTTTGTISTNGTAFVDLSIAAGTMTNPPAYDCYLLFNAGVPVWAHAGDALAPNATCTIGVPAGSTALRVGIAGAQSGQGYAIVVVY